MARRTPPEFEIEIEKLVFGGEGLGYYDSKPVFVYGALPGEKVLVRPVRVRGKFVKAALVKVIKKSKERRAEKDGHYLTSSPWEIMSEKYQLKLKKELVGEMWLKLAKELPEKKLEIEKSELDWGYRNKLEYSFCETDEGLSLAFHQRYYHNRYYALDNSSIAPEAVNICSQAILEELKKKKISIDDLKNLLVRYSFETDSCIAVLYVTRDDFETFEFTHERLQGWQIVYSNPNSPAAVTHKVLFKQGDLFLKERFGDIYLQYGYENFFQVNPKTFEKILDFIKENIKPAERLLDLYAGVGTIGLSLASKFKRVLCLEFDDVASRLTEKNIELNNLENVVVISSAAEKHDLDQTLKEMDCLVVDPPRSGLHSKVVKKIVDNPPESFIYVSCNPATQARDWDILKTVYKTTAWKLFDLYPQTPHVESVLVMKKK